MPILHDRASSHYSIHDFLAKLFLCRDDAPQKTRPQPPVCIPCARGVGDALEFCCVPISWQHRIVTIGEWELTNLVHQLGVRVPAGVIELSPAERRAFAALGTRAPPRFIVADSWRAVAEDSLERWWYRIQGQQASRSLLFELAWEHTIRGIPRIRRGSGAGEFLREPVRSDHVPMEERGVTHEWLRAFFAWMHELRVFRVPTRVFIECFAALVTAPTQCALYDFIPEAHRCAPQAFLCHALDDDLCALLAACHHGTAAWISFLAVGEHEAREEREPSLVERTPACVAACKAGLIVCLPGKGSPADALRPLLRSWCLLEICSAIALSDAAEADTDPYAERRSSGPAVTFAFGGIDDDVERHRAIAEALSSLSFEASAASSADEEVAIKRVLREAHGAEAEARLRDALRRAFCLHYSRPQHVHIRALYEQPMIAAAA